MIPGKNTRKDGKRNPAAREDLCFIRISLGPKDPKGKNQSFKKLKAFKQWRENMETMSLIDQKIDDWLKE